MAYGLWLTLDQDIWYRGDYSSENKLTGTIYTDKNRTVAKNLTGYTIKIRLFKPRTIGDRFNKTASIVTAADGTFDYAVGQGEMPIFGLYEVIVELSKSGVKESTLNHVELQVLEGPNA
jgi:hypothetical protein